MQTFQEQEPNPLIVQSDRTILLDTHAARSEECRNALVPFAELERSPEHLHTYRLTPLSLWNAASAGFSAKSVIQTLQNFSRYEIPQNVEMWIFETAERFGKIKIFAEDFESNENENPPKKNDDKKNSALDFDEVCEKKIDEKNSSEKKYPPPHFEKNSDSPKNENSDFPKTSSQKKIPSKLVLETQNEFIFKEISSIPQLKKILSPAQKKNQFWLSLTDRGIVKQKLLDAGWPVKDEGPLAQGEPLQIELRETTLEGKKLVVRKYQEEAARSIVADKGPGTGFGTIALPCGSGKTLVGMRIMSLLKTSTLVVTTNVTSVHQWICELLDKTTLQKEQIAEYTGQSKLIAPVTIATYQILTWRPDKESGFPHFAIFRERNWGLIIYDEVHLLPAPVFRVAAELQAVRRVGLTATLVREDGFQGHIFSLVGPKRYDVPWKDLERAGFIASAECFEVRVELPENLQMEYAISAPRKKHKIASTNPKKIQVAKELVEKFSKEKILVIGLHIEQLKQIAAELNAPLVTGKTPNAEREKIYADFRAGKNRVIVVSKVANFALDLPDASMAVELSGAFGSRQEEAQRLGRILRPKESGSKFFAIISRRTCDEDFSSNRQKFLTEQGYSYKIILHEEGGENYEAPLRLL